MFVLSLLFLKGLNKLSLVILDILIAIFIISWVLVIKCKILRASDTGILLFKLKVFLG